MTKALKLVAFCLFMLTAAPSAFAASIELPVARQTIPAGSEIGHRDLVERKFPSRTATQFAVASHRSQLVGQVTRRTLLPGQPIPINSVEQAVARQAGRTGPACVSGTRTGHHHAGRSAAERGRGQFRACSKRRQRFGRVRKSSAGTVRSAWRINLCSVCSFACWRF
jgi:hypothetical protein